MNPKLVENPFEGAADPVPLTKKELKILKKQIKKGKHLCDCGAFEDFNTLWPKWHDNNCIINQKGKVK